ncbi:MAG: hypothetical protein LBU65_07255 [Planctomycetaceae bacterium]|jgi:hypothetical protein|nr:hypothetical protein [Planctomycetaceae bacterium]
MKLQSIFYCVVAVVLSVTGLYADSDKTGTDVSARLRFEETGRALYRGGVLFDLNKSYPLLRSAYIYSFGVEYKNIIDEVWGGENTPFVVFLRQNPYFVDVLFSSINTNYINRNFVNTGRSTVSPDDIRGILSLYKSLWEKFPVEFERYPALAVAVVLTWGKPRRMIHSSPLTQHHAVTPDEKKLDALDNFGYYSKGAKVLGEERIKFMPYEYLTLVVNHETPMSERRWAIQNYGSKRAMIGKVYTDINYDYDMLNGKTPPKLEGKTFTLENELRYGGVCTCQADFAARVGKSLAVPIYKAGGMNKIGTGHAWVMWVEIESISADGMKFRIVEQGRYFKGHYFVGTSQYPPIGTVTDRRTAMELQSVGANTSAHRYAILLMKLFPSLVKSEQFTPREKFDYFCSVIDTNPYCTDAWIQLAQLVRAGEVGADCETKLAKYFKLLIDTFAPHPDFTWNVFDDLISFEAWKVKRTDNYAVLCSLYEAAKRPDLAVRAREQYANSLAKEGKTGEALLGMAKTCMKFPDEGDIIVSILVQMNQLCQKEPEKEEVNNTIMAKFYKQFLPKVPMNSSARATNVRKRIYELAVDVFERVGDNESAKLYQKELERISVKK